MAEEKMLKMNSEGVATHLSLLHGVITRMAGNSALCKTLCVTLVAAVTAVAATARDAAVLWVAVIPVLICCYLDCHYLALERAFRTKYTDFVNALHVGAAPATELYRIDRPEDYRAAETLLRAFASWSVRFVYPPLLILLVLVGSMMD